MALDILKSSIENASLSIIFQIMFRCVTFVLNAFTVRYVGQKILGVMFVRLLFMESTILFLSREAFLKACLTNTAEHNWAQVVNLLWLTVPVCTLCSILGGYIWLFLLESSESLPPYYTFAVLAIAISCVIEVSSTVVQLVASAFLFVRFTVILDSIMIALRTMLFVSMILYNPENALLAFGIAQLFGAIFITAGRYLYFHYYIKRVVKRHRLQRRLSMSDDGTEEIVESEFPFASIKDFLPGQLENHTTYLDKNLNDLTLSFFKQGFVKQVLTEGEKFIMTFLTVLTFSEQGVYEIVNNLGSLAARFIFRPIEDSSYFYFTQMIKRDRPISRQNPAKIEQSANALRYLCVVVTSLGLLILVFGQSYSSLLLWLYGGEKLTDTLPILLLRAHCLAILLLGVNGVTECYMNATADSDTINANNRIMLYESIAFLAASYIFTAWLGSVGFIFANCINMSIRIIHSTIFIKRRYMETNYKPLLGLIPKPFFSISLIVAAIVTIQSHVSYFPDDKFLHFFIGVVMFIIVLFSWIYENFDLIKLGLNKFFEKWYTDREDKSD